MRTVSIAVACIALTCLASCQSSPSPDGADTIVSPDEVLGRSFAFVDGKLEGIVSYERDAVRVNLADGRAIEGSLRVSGNSICTRYEQLRDGKEACFTFTRSGNGYVSSTGGRLTPI